MIADFARIGRRPLHPLVGLSPGQVAATEAACRRDGPMTDAMTR